MNITRDEQLVADADDCGLVLSIYLVVGIPLSLYLFHDVIDKRWRRLDYLRNFSFGYGVFSLGALGGLVFYATTQFKAKIYTEGGAACLSCAIALYGLYLGMRRAFILYFFCNHLQRRANSIVSAYDNKGRGPPDDETRQCTLWFPEGGYRQGPAIGHLSSVILDDDYPGDGPRVTWLARMPSWTHFTCLRTPMVKDWTEMMVRTGLWIRLAVIPSSLSFDTALRPSSVPSGSMVPTDVDTSGAWTLAVVQQQFLASGKTSITEKKNKGKLETFTKCVGGENDTLVKWREALSLAPESEWSRALSEFPPDWIEGLQARGIAWEVYLALALHSAETMGPTKSPRRCWPRCINDLQCKSAFCCCWGGGAIPSGAQSSNVRVAGGPDELKRLVENLIHATLGEAPFVMSAVLMAGFPQEDGNTRTWMKFVQQLAEIWHRLAQSLATEDNSLDQTFTEGIDLVIALAVLLGADRSSFEVPCSNSRGQGMADVLKMRQTHVLETLQDAEAENLLRASLERCRTRNAPGSDIIAQSHYSLGKFLHDRRQYANAHEEYDLAIEIWEGNEDKLKRADVFTRKADMYTQQGKYPKADDFYIQANEIIEPAQDRNRFKYATLLEKSAVLRKKQGIYKEADHLYVQARYLRRFLVCVEDRINFAATLDNHAGLITAQGNYEKAGRLYPPAIKLWKDALGNAHPQVATALSNWVELLARQGKYSEAQTLLNENSLTTFEEAHGLEHPAVATALSAQAELLRAQRNYKMAEPLYRRALRIDDTTPRPDQLCLIRDLRKLAKLLQDQGRYGEADRLYARAIRIGKETLGDDHPDVATWLADRAGLLRVQGNFALADLRYRDALRIRESMSLPKHPDMAKLLNDWGGCSRGEFAKAAELYGKSLDIQQEVLDPKHPAVATTLKNQAALLTKLGKYAQAESRLEDAEEIQNSTPGPRPQDAAQSLNNRAAHVAILLTLKHP